MTSFRRILVAKPRSTHLVRMRETEMMVLSCSGISLVESPILRIPGGSWDRGIVGSCFLCSSTSERFLRRTTEAVPRRSRCAHKCSYSQTCKRPFIVDMRVASLEEEDWCAAFSDCCGYCVMLTQFSHAPHYQGSRSCGDILSALIVRPCSDQYWTPGTLVGNSFVLARVGADQRHGRLFPQQKNLEFLITSQRNPGS
jgi:hypothetical protein